MLQLTLVRHAKSNWGDTTLSDFDRPLNERGFRDTPLIGNVLNEKLAICDHIISSPAKRAITTANLLAEKLGHPEEDVIQDQKLYNASLHTLLKVIHELDSAVKHCVLVAHNPGLSLLADHLDSGQTGDLPTCAVVSFTFELNDWQAIGRGNGKLVLFEYPKKYN
jgi:phosphohistidine phosphatase